MDNTIFVGLSRQMALQRQLDVIANNVANMNTTAFKSESVTFNQYLAPPGTASATGGGPLAMVYDVGLQRNLGEGGFVHTDNPLDMAIRGKGYFTVQAVDGSERYTRNGHFELGPDGTLMSAAGRPLLNDAGKSIILSAADTNLEVLEDGTLTTSAGRIGRLAIVEFADEQSLTKAGDGMFKSSPTAAPPVPATDARLQQGMLESSNVIPVMEMTKMIELMRGYQSTGKLISDFEDLQRRAVRVLGSFN